MSKDCLHSLQYCNKELAYYAILLLVVAYATLVLVIDPVLQSVRQFNVKFCETFSAQNKVYKCAKNYFYSYPQFESNIFKNYM